MQRLTWRQRRWLLPLAVFLTSGGCGGDLAGPADYSLIPQDGETFFLVSPIKPNAVMDALFQGEIAEDSSGCIRLQPPSGATVVWPKGFSLDVTSAGARVLDEDGMEVGVIGSTFRFGGGEVPLLHEGLGFPPTKAAQIQSRCPGRFWIVGEV